MTILARPRSHGPHGNEGPYGWLFTLPAILILGIFLVIPILLAIWVSFSNWNGLGPPVGGQADFVGTANYAEVLTQPGLARRDFGIAIRNNLYYVLLVVPIQTAVALFLAVQVNRRVLAARGFFRTAFYFPSVTSSVAITVVFLYLFSASGVVNGVLNWIRIRGPNWFADPRGVFHIVLGWLGVEGVPSLLAGEGPLGVTWWEWVSGPSVAMTALIALAVFTTSGTFMLLFLAGLQAIGSDIEEAALVDGAGPVRKFFSITLPMLKPTLFTVLTLGLIATWQVFDQIYLTGGGSPAKTTLTPAFLAYSASFESLKWGRGAAISFILFGIIVVLTIFQRWVLRDREGGSRRGRRRRARTARAAAVTAVRPGGHDTGGGGPT